MAGDDAISRSRWQVLSDPGEVAAESLRIIQDCATRSVTERGVFLLVLAGGSTPLEVYRRLVASDIDTGNWEIFFGDERCLPRGHPGRNDEAARQVWLDEARIPPARIHSIPAELGPVEGAKAYTQQILPWQPFDLVLLGVGEDGHVASLFPGHQHIEGELVVGVTNAAKPPPERVSLNYGTLCAARQRLLMATGTGKREAIMAWQSAKPLPVTRVGNCGALTTLLDRAAFP